MRFLHPLTLRRSLSLVREGFSVSTSQPKRNFRPRCAVAHLTIAGQNPSRHDCRQHGFTNSSDGGCVRLSTFLRLEEHHKYHKHVGLTNVESQTFKFTSAAHRGDAGELDERIKRVVSCAESGDIAEAEELLYRMQADAASQNDSNGLPDVESYTALMDAFVDGQRRLMSAIKEKDDGSFDAPATVRQIMAFAEKSDHLLAQMEELSGVLDRDSPAKSLEGADTDTRNASLRPDARHYDAAILAFANAAIAAHDANGTHLTKRAPFAARRWLERMEALAIDPRSDVRPTVDSYFRVMEAFVANNEAPFLAQAVFDKLRHSTSVHPTVREYRLMMRQWCHNPGDKEATYRATEIWWAMQKDFQDGAKDMEPLLEDGKLVLGVLTRSVKRDAARRAHSILARMEELHLTKKSHVRPDLDCYRCVFVTMARSRMPTVGKIIPEIFKSMEGHGISPDAACFDAAIETLAKGARRASSEEEAIKYANATESMLLRMEREGDRSSESVIRPSAATYTNAIRALATRQTNVAAEKADEILRRMEVEYASGNESMRPTRDSYMCTIQAYANSDGPVNFVSAEKVLRRMIAQHLEGNEDARPDVPCFHAVLWACASSPLMQHKKALLLAVSTLQYMEESEAYRPSSKSYLLLLQCCANVPASEPTEREEAIQSIFRKCQKDGLVSQGVLKEFQSMVSPEVYHEEVLRDAPTYQGVKTLPQAWTRSLGRRNATTNRVPKRKLILSVEGEMIRSITSSERKMRRLWAKTNQKILRGGRLSMYSDSF